MARATKTGLEYFPLDVDIDQDDKVYFIEAKYGIIGFAVIIKLLMLIYKEGYYKHYDDNKDAFLLAKRFSVDVNVVKNIINDCINEGLFNKNLYEKYGILTSKGIQKRYLEACTRRKEVNIIKEYCLVDIENYKNVIIEYINPVNVDINPGKCNIMSTEMPQSKVKESKVKNIERDINAHARDNTSHITDQESSRNDFSPELQKIYNKAFEFGMSGVTPEFLEDAQMRLSEGADVELIIKALSIGATKAHGNAGAKCRYAISVLQSWAAEGIKTLEQWEAKNTPKPTARDKPMKTRAEEREEAFERAREEARRMLREEGVIQDDV